MKQFLGETAKQRWARLKEALCASNGEALEALLSRLERCRTDWGGRFPCRSPACPTCRRKNIRDQQKAALETFADCDNSDIAFVSVCGHGCREVEDLGPALAKTREDLRNRVEAAGLSGVRIKGWNEVDAVGSDQFPLLPPQRYRLLCEIAPISVDQMGATWLPSFHALIDRNRIDIAEIRHALTQQWPIAGQVDVRPLNAARNVTANIRRVVSYSTKFSSLTALRSDRRTGAFLDPAGCLGRETL